MVLSDPWYEGNYVHIPYWLLALMTLLLPSWWVWRYRRIRREARRGLCRDCGYDLRATPDRCPECGLKASSSADSTVHFLKRRRRFIIFGFMPAVALYLIAVVNHIFGSMHFHEQVVRPLAALLSMCYAVAISWLMALEIRLHFRTRRAASTLCPICDYDLRASPNRCPECGTPR